ncbi:hypothetical protein ABUE30_14510 [Celerinatantimonas yamalensis]|uniref:DUF6916 domain-containing protein n=2 Tax=Celerinatantimonas yamalensis TaxID=559956 RepID=A0ABW9GB52_9GAMM
MTMLPTYEEFKSQLDKEFIINYEQNKPPKMLLLKKISPIESIGGGFSGFGMTFAALLGNGYLMQKQWLMKNEALGDVSLFLVPAGPQGEFFEYNVTLTFKQ